MTKRMLIDATHSEETRVAVVDGKRLEDFDYESTFRKPMKGSIFLAKVTRVEPSLQAAFVNFGGNRHGFLPFSEIHPDYFRIPIADREALIAEQEAMAEEAAKEEEEEENELEEEEKAKEKNKGKGTAKGKGRSKKTSKKDDDDVEVVADDDDVTELDGIDDVDEDDENIGNRKRDDEDEDDDGGQPESNESELVDGGDNSDGKKSDRGRGRGRGGRGRGRGGRSRPAQHRSKKTSKYDKDSSPEQRFRSNLRRKYKIQEVIKRGQIMLVQVNKEERGNKGAAVGSYLSLPGRYCVLMPNSPRAGGVSRKIANYKDRARMREIMKELEVPKGMSVILRTAGVSRTKAEIKRDLDYLMRLWDSIRALTLESSAPALVYEEADLIKRAVRDLYTRDVEEIHVAGDEGYKTARNFMKMMIPSHVKKVHEYKEQDIPLFNRYQIENQIAEIGEVQVTLPSGGYLVINPTEALVSIDVNSGKSTKERHIEGTALKTNLEAAVEVARQLRLRDLGGLVVIDFIDMEDRRNNGKVERKMRDALSGDRARIQVGRISSFGLMELSRQRLSPSLGESQFKVCPHCEGAGRIRTADGAAVMVLRAIEEEGMRGRAAALIVHVSNEVAQYILNNKRTALNELEQRHNLTITIRVDDDMAGGHFRVEVSKPSNKGADDDDASKEDESKKSDDGARGKGRRRGRRGGRRRNKRGDDQDDNNTSQESLADELNQDQDGEDQTEDKTEKPKKKPVKKAAKPSSKTDDEKPSPAVKAKDDKDDKDKKKPAKKPAAKKAPAKKEKAAPAEEKAEKPQKKAPAKAKSKASNDDKAKDAAHKDYEKVNEAPKEKKKGWWNR